MIKQQLQSRLRSLLLLPALALLAACGDDPQPAEIRLSPSSISLDAVGDVATVRATVLDEEGIELPEAIVTWTSSDPAVVRVNSGGIVTATGPGTASIRAEAGAISAQAGATVEIVVSTLEAVSNTEFDAEAGSTISPIAVRAVDRLGNPVVGATITGIVVSGGGNLAETQVVTNAQGVAEFEWNVGSLLGTGRIRLRAPGNAPAIFVDVTVSSGPPAIITQTGGAGQAGLPGAVLPDALTFSVEDAFGNPVTASAVTFAVTQGGGSLSVTQASPDAAGTVSTELTLGPAAGDQVVEATAGSVSVSASAVAVADPAAIQIVGDASVTGEAGLAVAGNLAVRLLDGGGTGIPGVPIRFEPAAGSGTIADAVGGTQVGSLLITTDAQGDAVLPEWVLGTVAGAQSLTASFPGLGSVVVDAQAIPGRASTGTVISGDRQVAVAGNPLVNEVVIGFADQFGNVTPGVTVSLSVTTGTGSISASSAITDAEGQISFQWTVGGTEGLQEVAADAQDASVLAAAGSLPDVTSDLDVQLEFLTDLDSDIWYEFQASVATWRQFIKGDLADVASPTIPEGSCGGGNPEFTDPIDDLVIFIYIQEIDGPSGILGQAGPCFIRSSVLPIAGLMRFDVADLRRFQDDGLFDEIIFHEMGHVFGIGTLWDNAGFLVDPTEDDRTPLDTHFIGPEALAAFETVGGDSYTGGQKVPVENEGGPGTRNGHWRESVFDTELMTGLFDVGFNPVSVVTVASLEDLGYVVDYTPADPYTLPGVTPPISAQRLEGGSHIHLVDDIWRGPIRVAPSWWMR